MHREGKTALRNPWGAKGNLSKGKAGWPVPGISVPYEEPLHPELLIATDRTPLAETVEMIEDL